MYENRYGVAEMNGTGWRSVGEYNWWDWEIGSPRHIIDVMMIVYEHLDSMQIKNWLTLFHYVVPRGSYTGSNMLNLGKELIGAAILEKDANVLVSARDAVNATFVYSDKGNNGGFGYNTDGSYLFHTHHAMNATYGLEQIEYTGPLLSLLAGTEFEYTNPQVDNIVDWIIEGQIPFDADGIYMRSVTGRYPANPKSYGVDLVSAMIDLLDFVEGEEYEQFRTLIKYFVTKDTKTNFFTELTIAQGIELKKILQDDTVAERGRYELNKTFAAIDKTVHHREDWVFGISLNSERIAGYESINDCNREGWYHGDGMYQIFVDADQYQYHNPYWVSVNPDRTSYEYIILPGMTKEETEEYSKNPQIEILANTQKIQAVKNKELGITAIVFWERGSFAELEVSEPMLVMIREGDGVTVSVCDPTQKLDSAVITIKGNFTGSDVPARVNTLISGAQTVLEVNFSNALGRTIETEFSK